MNAIKAEKVIYALASLLETFTQTLAEKTTRIAGYGSWAVNWPGGNTRSEQLAVDWLRAQQRDGLTRIETKFPLTDASSLGDPNHTLSMQIRNNLAFGIR